MLYAVLLLLAATGLSYELALGTVATFLIGDPITQFALLIGLYMAALGLGAYASEWITRDLELRFVDAALGTAAVGGSSSTVLFVTFGLDGPFRVVLYGATLAIGTMVGVQLPLLMRILKRRETFADVVARGLAFDYAGALVGSVGFSLVLLPSVGLVRGAVALGIVNLLAAAYVMRLFARNRFGARLRLALFLLVGLGLLAMWLSASWIDALTERPL